MHRPVENGWIIKGNGKMLDFWQVEKVQNIRAVSTTHRSSAVIFKLASHISNILKYGQLVVAFFA